MQAVDKKIFWKCLNQESKASGNVSEYINNFIVIISILQMLIAGRGQKFEGA